MLDHRTARDAGFTLIEVLVVCLIIAILTAIALPTFLRQQNSAQDADAKSNARNLVSHVEACEATTSDYQQCATTAELGTTGLPLVDGAPVSDDTVGVAAATKGTYTITAQSRHSHATFSISKVAPGVIQRTCSGPGGGCTNGSW
jgi:type IV pilus assembly protein PilA